MNNSSYIKLILLHIAIGVLLYFIPILSMVYCHSAILFGFFWIFRNRNANDEVLIVLAYIIGSELIVKMTKGYFVWEYAKYSVIFLTIVGIYFKGFKLRAIPIWIYGLLLLPSIFVGFIVLGSEPRLRQTIIFNILGPLTLFTTSLYCFMHTISLKKLLDTLLYLSLPIISCLIYSILYTPDLKEILIHTGSNFETSGGYGPNQVATFFGFAMFTFFTRALIASPTKLMVLLNIFLCFAFAYRGLLTFSRGGLISGLLMILFFLFFLFQRGNKKTRISVTFLLSVLTLGILIIWFYSTFITGGLIEKRYKNQDALGREKASLFTGRELVALSEINLFLENPFLGGGVGSGKKYREENYDLSVASHNEMTRMIGEHGSLGIIGLLILIFTPLVLYVDNKSHIFLLSFFLFWFLTLNHTSMRVALPAFIYALTLLKVQINEKPIIPRKQTLQNRHQSLYH